MVEFPSNFKQMIKKKSYNKILIVLVTCVFTLVNLSVISNVFCSMKDMSSCCCKVKTEKKSCCANKNVERYTSACVCEMKESNTDPAELQQSFTTTNNVSKTIKIFTPAQIAFSGNENQKVFSNYIINTFHSPPGEDINTLKCVLRI